MVMYEVVGCIVCMAKNKIIQIDDCLSVFNVILQKSSISRVEDECESSEFIDYEVGRTDCAAVVGTIDIRIPQ